MTRTVSFALACSLLLLTAAPAFAQSPKEGKKDGKDGPDTKACQADFDKYCKNVKPGEGRIMVCMESNVDRLSPECAKVVKEKAHHDKAMREKKMGDKKPAAKN